MKNFCDKGWHDGSCCCNCEHHIEDFYHCTTSPKPDGAEGCVCSIHKGWICLISMEGETPIAHSNWSEHGMCEMHYPKKPINMEHKCKYTDQHDHWNIDDHDFIEAINNFFSFKLWKKKIWNWVKKPFKK